MKLTRSIHITTLTVLLDKTYDSKFFPKEVTVVEQIQANLTLMRRVHSLMFNLQTL